MEKIVNKSYMYNLELQSLHYWFKNALSQNPSIKYSNISKIMQGIISDKDMSDIINTNTQQSANPIQRSHINFHQRMILRNVFDHWKIYVVHKLHTRRATYKADYFYYKKLQKKVLNAFSKNVLLKWKYIVSSMDTCTNKFLISVNLIKAEKHYSKSLLRKYFTYWCSYILIVNKEKALLERAQSFYNMCCLNKCITNWKIYVMLQRQKKMIQDKVDEAHKLYAKKVLRNFLRAWINVCDFPLQKSKTECAIMHYKNKLLEKYFYAWTTYHNYKLEKLNKEECVVAYYRKNLLKQYFKQFIVCVNESITDRIANENAEIFYNSKLMQKVYFAWQGWYNKKVQNAMKICEMKSILDNKRKRRILINWRLYVVRKKCKRRKMFAAQHFFEKKLAVKFLRKFRSYAVYRKEKKIKLSYLNSKSEKIIGLLQNVYIEKWRRALYSTVQDKQKLNRAIEFWEFRLTCKYFSSWKTFSQQYKMKMVHKETLNEIAHSFLLKRYIVHWHTKLQDVLVTRKKEILVISMIKHKIMKKCFLSWKEYIVQKVILNNNIEAAIVLHTKFLLREGLKKILRNSLRNIDHERDMQLENAATKSFANLEILKEYFDKWHSVIYLKDKSKLMCKITNSQVTQTQPTYNKIFDSFKTHLVIPEYMMKENTISNTCDSFATHPQENWPFNLFQPF